MASSDTSNLILAEATADERSEIWTQQQPYWGPQYSVQGFIQREQQLLTCQLSKDDGVKAYILTDASPPGTRPILSSLEVFRKRALIKDPDGTLRDVTAHAIASVFTFDSHRRRGYCSRMLSLLGDKLTAEGAEVSILYSDIGKTFYTQHGWVPFPSFHLGFLTEPFTAPPPDGMTLVTKENLQSVAELDERILREKLASSSDRATKFALLPDFAAYEWHLAREASSTTHVLGVVPSVHGAVYTPPGQPSSRVLMLWACELRGGTTRPEKNILNCLHLALEDEAISDQHLTDAFRSIFGVAHAEAEKRTCTKLELWSPGQRVQRLIGEVAELRATLVVREEEHIASLKWFGEGSVSDVEWVDNDKFGWC